MRAFARDASRCSSTIATITAGVSSFTSRKSLTWSSMIETRLQRHRRRLAALVPQPSRLYELVDVNLHEVLSLLSANKQGCGDIKRGRLLFIRERKSDLIIERITSMASGE